MDTADLELHDGGVWVTKQDNGFVGHLNHASQVLDGGFRAPFEKYILHQQDEHAVMVSPASGALVAIDGAQIAAGDQVMLPATQGFSLGGTSFSAHSTEDGTVFAGVFTPSPVLTSEDPLHDAEGTVASTTTIAGEVLVADVEAGELHRYVPSDQGRDWTEGDPEPLEALHEMGSPVMTSVGSVGIVVDPSSGTVAWLGGRVQDDRLVGAVPQPSGPSSEVVALSTAHELLTVRLSDQSVSAVSLSAPDDVAAGALQSGGSAEGREMTAPVSAAGCVHAASRSTGYYLKNCQGEHSDEIVPIPELSGAGELVFRVNRDQVVLNDTGDGTTWMVLEQMKVVSNWDDLEPPKGEGEDTEEESDEVTQQTALPERQEENRPPVAVDDTFGVRAGRTTQLPVLFNDSDPDGDVLVAALTGEQPSVGTVQRILDGVGLQIVVPEDASGSATVRYEARDGRPEGTDDAVVQLRVVPESENSAPTQERVPVLRVPAGESVSAQMFPDWIDPDGDDLQLVGATSPDEDSVRTRPDGQFTFQDNSGEPGLREVQLTVSDGRETATGKVQVQILERGSVEPPVTLADHVTVQAGQVATVTPLVNDQDPLGGSLRLAFVQDIPALDIAYSATGGTVQISGDEPGTHYLEYIAANELDSAPGLIRVDVVESGEDSGLPVAVRDTALLPSGGDVLVNVLGNDTDPAGGILVVQGVRPLQGETGGAAPIKVAVEDFNHIRVVDTGGLARPITFTYEVSNAQGTSTGEVTVVPLPQPVVLEPPVAVPDTAVVRVGDVATLDVLANDVHPNQEELILEPELAEAPAPERLDAFTSEGMLRVQAGEEPGRTQVSYTVRGPDGQRASAVVDITMVAMDRANNSAPVPPTVRARVLAGESVSVPISLDGSDPDGDSVTLVGVDSPPRQGSVRLEQGRLVYSASNDSAGTDTFTYLVTDRLGATAVGTVSIGLARALEVNHPPVALDDSVEVRPGRTFTTNVLSNDADPDGDQVTLVRDGFTPSIPDTPIEIIEGRVQVQAPDEPGFLNISYTISDPAGARGTGNLAVSVSPGAPLLAPIARDDILGHEQIADEESVVVPVLSNDEDPDGAVSDLTVTVDEATEMTGVRVQGQDIVVPVGSGAQTVKYTLTDIDGQVGHAFILVPGNDNRPPWLLAGESLEVVAGERLAVDLDRHVGVRDGRRARLISDDAATAAPTNASLEVASATTMTFTAAEDFSGNASVNVSVTDGESGTDPNGLVSTLSIPVTVLPRPDQNDPPRVQSTQMQIEQGGDPVSMDLAPLASDPDGDELTFELGDRSGDLAATLEGTVLTVTPAANARRGGSGSVDFTVTDGASDPVAARVSVDVVGTSRGLPRANADLVQDARSGDPVVVPALENDVNPFEGEAPLTIVDTQVVVGEGTATTNGTTVTVTPGENWSGRMRVTYTIQDMTQDQARQAHGEITVVVKGVPGAPGVPRIEGVEDGQVSLSWAAPPDNGAPITGYTVTDTTTGRTQACSSTTCTITGLENAVEHRFTGTATNEVGESDPSGTSAPAVPDVRPEMPAAPSATAEDGRVDLTWTPPTNRGSAITEYRVQISPALSGGVTRSTGATTSLRWDGLSNGVPYRFRIQALNQADEPSDWSAWSVDVTPAGKPFAPGTPTAARDQSVVDGGVVRVAWAAANDNGAPLSGYTVTAYAGNSVAGTREVRSGTTSLSWPGLEKSTAYRFAVTATNSKGDSPSSGQSSAVTPFGLPGAVSNVRTSATGQDNTLTLAFSGAAANGSPVRYEYSLGGGWTSLGTATSDTIRVPANGSTYTVSVRAVNEAGSGPAASASTVVAYGPFRMPQISAEPKVGSLTFTWNPDESRAGNGRTVTYAATVNGSQVPNSGRYQAPYQRQATGYRMEIRVCTTDGAHCQTAAQAAQSTAVPAPTARLSIGAEVVGGTCDETAGEYTNCWRTIKQIEGLDPSQDFTLQCIGRVAPGEPRAGEESIYLEYPQSADATGRYQSGNDMCITHDGFSEFQIGVKELGIRSNKLVAPWP